jgi:uncharacterized protein YkwD
MFSKNNLKPLFLSLLLCLTLIACGGGSGSGDETTQTTPDDTPQDSSDGTDTTNPDDSSSDPAPNPDQSDTTTPPTEEPPQPTDDTPPSQTVNQAPVATISGDTSATSGETLTLDGSSSSDPDGDTLTFLWSQTAGNPITLVDSTNPSLSFIAPDVTQTTSLRFQLSVGDGEFTTTTSIDIQVSPIADTTAPTITTRSPLPDAIGVSTTTNISISFNETLQQDLLDDQSLQLTQSGSPVTGTVSYDATSDSLTLTLDSALLANTRYSVTLGTNLQDPAGNPVANESWDFTTGTSYNLGATTQATIDQCMNESDKLMLTLVNNARATARYCDTTEYAAVAPIAWNCLLESAAQNHSTSMADYDYFSHTGLDGSSPGDRISASGYNWRAYAENIAAGYNDEEAVMTGWLESPGHCANIMSTQVTEIGAAVAENPGAEYRIYWTQDYADQQ